jgi:2-dehydro-3-deoxygalactonokinase
VSVSGGVVQEFLTAPTGEVFGLLCEHSVLVRDKSTPVTHVTADFERGLAEAARHPGALMHQLFQARSLRLDKQLSPQGAASFASGLLIGADVGGALEMFGAHDPGTPVLIIGAPRLTESYALALARRGRRAVQVDGAQASFAGLAYIFREQERQHA